MDKVIERLIEIENKAQSVVKDAKKLHENIDNIVEENVGEIKGRIAERETAKEKTIAQIEEDAADQRIQEIQRYTAAAEQNLQQVYEQNIDRWVDQIFQEIIAV